MDWLIQRWYKKNFFCYLLLPFTVIYCFVIFFRRLFYRLGLKKTTHFSVPVIVVGNISVGGTGKTPLVIWMANFLRQQGFHPGIVSRGHGGKATTYPQQVTAQSDPLMVGDEAVLIAAKTQCPMMVAPKRTSAVAALLKNNDCDVVISDDGLQHYALGRAIEIAVIDGQRRFGNGFCLPAGPLREPWKRLQQVDFIIANGAVAPHEYAMQLAPKAIYNLAQPELILNPQQIHQPVHAVAGIGNPQRFFSSLRLLGLQLIEHPFPDHYLFQKKDLAFADNLPIIMTEKDAVKCQRFADERFWCLPIEVNIDKNFSVAVLKKLQQTIRTQHAAPLQFR